MRGGAGDPLMKRICVFCGSSAGTRPQYLAAARGLGATLAERGFELVYGGSHAGLMGALADAALDRGARVTGVIPEALVSREVAHRGLAELRIVPSMHARKQLMADLADGFIALPGGMGTLEELTEILTWAQLGIHAKPCGLLDVEGYFSTWLAFLDHAVNEGFLKPAHRRLLLVDEDPGALLQRFGAYEPPHGGRPMDRQQR